MFEKGGVKGTPPLGCISLWGREGVTLTIILKGWLFSILIYPAKSGSGAICGQRILQ